jgi:hypothetical protein
MDESDFKGAATPRSSQAVERAAKTLNVKPAILWAIIDVETNGSGFDSHGRPKALFEPHLFYRELGDDEDKQKEAVAKGLAYPKQGMKPYPKDSYPRILQAIEIYEEAALRSTSWGLPQILGSNFKLAGFDSVESMVKAFVESEDAQIAALAMFLQRSGIVPHMQSLDFDGIAQRYNGKNYRAAGYQTKLRNAYQKRLQAAIKAAGVSTDKVALRLTDAPVPQIPADATDESQDVPDLDAGIITKAQQRLRDLGYPEVGNVDGKMGSRTSGAISSFQGDQGLPLTGEFDEQTINLLMDLRTAPRPVSTERATATAEDLKNAPTVNMGQTLKTIGTAVVGASGLGGIATGSMDFADATQKISSVKDFAKEVLSISPWFLGAGVGAVILYFGGRIVFEQVQAYRQGRHV